MRLLRLKSRKSGEGQRMREKVRRLGGEVIEPAAQQRKELLGALEAQLEPGAMFPVFGPPVVRMWWWTPEWAKRPYGIRDAEACENGMGS